MRSLARCRSDDFLDLLAIQCPTPVFTAPTHTTHLGVPYPGSVVWPRSRLKNGRE